MKVQGGGGGGDGVGELGESLSRNSTMVSILTRKAAHSGDNRFHEDLGGGGELDRCFLQGQQTARSALNLSR